MNNLDRDYLNLLQDILENGVKKETRNGGTLSVFGRQIRHSMKDGFPLLTTKKMYFKGIVVELLWFLRGDTSIKYLLDNDCNIWTGDAYKRFTYYTDEETSMERFVELIKTDDEFAKKWGSLGPVYGKQWRNWEGIDQISELIKQLKDTPDSRRMVVNAWAVHDLPNMVLPPCHYGFQVYTRELSLQERNDYYTSHYLGLDCETHEELDKLGDIPKRAISLMWNQRSVDTFLGLPFNIASYGLLLEIIAKEVNMVPDELIGNLGDVHLYSNHVEQAKEQIVRIPFELPTLKIEDEVKWKEGDCLPSYSVNHLTIENYRSHPSIKAPLSN